jgi:F-type H+-transporting ATPase subunit delta
MPAAVASRYARALVDVALAPTAAVGHDRVRQDLRAFEQALAASPELSIVLASPGISRPRKRAVIGRLVESLGLSGISRNFLFVLVDHRRTADLSAIIEVFEKMVDERLGTLKVEVSSARALDGQQQGSLIQRLETMTGKKIVLNLDIDSDLVGGLVVRLGSTVYDGSVRGQLETLGRQLTNIQNPTSNI